MIIPAIFRSVWEEGTVESPCDIDTETFEVFDIITVNEGEQFEHLIRQEVLVKVGQDEYEPFLVEENNEYEYVVDADVKDSFLETVKKIKG